MALTLIKSNLTRLGITHAFLIKFLKTKTNVCHHESDMICGIMEPANGIQIHMFMVCGVLVPEIIGINDDE